MKKTNTVPTFLVSVTITDEPQPVALHLKNVPEHEKVWVIERYSDGSTFTREMRRDTAAYTYGLYPDGLGDD